MGGIMRVIVFSKRTGKYLKRHSGSFGHKVRMLQYNDKVRKTIIEKFGPYPSWKQDGVSIYQDFHRDVHQFCEDLVFDANPEDARVYASETSATTSVGTRTTWVVPEHRSSSNRVYVLPDHLEIHEIKESFVCVMKPDGSSNCDDEDAEQSPV
jgi:hypothetical protein